jgi:hypothetical protein
MATDIISTSSGIPVVRESRGMGVMAVTGMGTRDTTAGRVLRGTDQDRVDRVDHREEGEGTPTRGRWRGMESIRHRRRARMGMAQGHTVGVRMVDPEPVLEPDHMAVVVAMGATATRTLPTLTVVEAGTEPHLQPRTAVIRLQEVLMAHRPTRMAVHHLAVTPARVGTEDTERVQEARMAGIRMRRNHQEVSSISGSKVKQP